MAARDSIEVTEMTLSDWDRKGTNGTYCGKQTFISDDLIKLSAELFPDGGSRKQSVLFPMCGEAVDMKYVSDQGHSVIGIEYSKVAILDFFRNHKLDYTKEKCEANGKLEIYRVVRDADITIYQGDIFDCDHASLGFFDVVWDKGAWTAINPCDRHRYVETVRQFVTKETRYCLTTVTLDQRQYNTHPYSSTKEEIEEYFGDHFNIDQKISYENELFREMLKVDSYVTSVYLFTLRDQPTSNASKNAMVKQ